MLSTRRITKTFLVGLFALVSAPAGAAASTASSGAVWGYHPPAEQSAEDFNLCSLDAPYNETPFTRDGDSNVGCPTAPPDPPPRCTGDFCLPGNVCKGNEQPHENSNGCGVDRNGDTDVDTGITCCEAGSVTDGVVNVLPYVNVTRPEGADFSANPAVDERDDVDDSLAISRAIECAMSQPTTRHTVYFPAGRYVLRTPLRPEHSNLTLEGPELSPNAAPGDPGTATLVAVPCNPEQFPGAIQVNKPGVSGVWIRNFQIRLTDGPWVQANSGIRVNSCSNCEVENIIMRYAPLPDKLPQPPQCKPPNLDGITFGLGSWGAIRNVIVDGVPKGGIYLSTVSTGTNTTPHTYVENCEIRNINGPVGAAGIKIITSNVTVRNCEVHHSLIHPRDGLPAVGGHGLWIAAQNSNPSTRPRNVLVQDSYFHHNGGSGVMMASPIADKRPEKIRLEGVRSAYNGSYGVHIQAGTDVELLDLWSWGNGYSGVYLQSKGSLPASALRVGTVTLENPIIFNNALTPEAGDYPGIMIHASDVTINGGEFGQDDGYLPQFCTSRGRQSKSIQWQCWLSGPPGAEVLFYPEDIVYSDVFLHDGTSAPHSMVCPYD
ncbi:glycosyl hydrolase family 28-related protein [Sorangium sp. So ce296]|uniref:right-handed parallel beta-helix repeat-containing protein n=1 Tax=Sorangium sp. So ce296 TaxID=3133296 RepID=UPI003F600D4E